MNMRPLGVLPNADDDVLEPLTPNHLLLGRSGRDVPVANDDRQASLPVRYRYVLRLTEDWWQRWTELVYPTLVPSYRWLQRHRSVKVGDVCLMKYAKMAKGSYRLCGVEVEEVKESRSDGLVRRAIVVYKNPGAKEFKKMDWPIQSLVLVVIVPIEEQIGETVNQK